jgi:carboxylate-amine ligase
MTTSVSAVPVQRPWRIRTESVPSRVGPTFGVEEEFLLLDPACGQPVPASPAVLRLLADRSDVQPELMRFQLETATAVCGYLSELRTELVRLRRSAAAAAEALGCRLVASGISPYGTPRLTALTDTPRYRELARRYPMLTARFGTCGCNVHVAVPSPADLPASTGGR